MHDEYEPAEDAHAPVGDDRKTGRGRAQQRRSTRRPSLNSLRVPAWCVGGSGGYEGGARARRGAAGAREGRNPRAITRVPQYVREQDLVVDHRARSWGPVSGKGDHRSRLGSRERGGRSPAVANACLALSRGEGGEGGGRAARRPGDSSHGSRRTSSHGGVGVARRGGVVGRFSRHASFGFR